MRPPRLRIRSLMVAVAISGIVCWLGVMIPGLLIACAFLLWPEASWDMISYALAILALMASAFAVVCVVLAIAIASDRKAAGGDRGRGQRLRQDADTDPRS